MLLAFTDESYSDAHYYQAALIIDEVDLPTLAAIIEAATKYVNKFGVYGDVEFHGNEIMSARNEWEPLKDKFRMKSAIFKFIFKQISQLDAALLIQGVDVKRLRNRYQYPQPPNEVTHRNLLDAIDRYAENQNSLIRVIADQINTQERLERLFMEYQLLSTGGPFPRKLRHISGIEYVKSHHHPGIQLVDLCVFIFRRFDEHIENSVKTRHEVQILWSALEPLIRKDFLPRVWKP